jgi:hypothetical protein
MVDDMQADADTEVSAFCRKWQTFYAFSESEYI